MVTTRIQHFQRNHRLVRMGNYLFLTLITLLIISPAGCTGDDPNTSAPQRQVIDRTADWQGSLLYIADQHGPNPSLGSIRIYDNVSGFVEKTVDQVVAAAPSDMYVTPDGSTMYVAGHDNGRIDKFRWDGNNWIRGGVTIDSPAQSLSAIAAAPDGKVYLLANGAGSAGMIYRLNVDTDRVDGVPQSIPQISELRGIAWSPDGRKVFLSGRGQDLLPRLFIANWPSLEFVSSIDLTGASNVSQSVASADGNLVYVMADGNIYIVDPLSSAVTGVLTPSGNTNTSYSDGALSGDGKYLFATGNLAGDQASLYIIDLSNSSLVKKVGQVAETAGGVQRVE